MNILYENLAILHHFKIVHMDIKPENIMLSPSFRKPVFIDFGLSKIIKEEKGYKSLSGFVGTVNFCYKEMANCVV